MAYKCQKKTKRGKRCGASALIDSKYCYTHDPKRASERSRAHSLGGLRRRQAARRREFPADCDLMTIQGLIKFGVAQIQETWKLGNSVGRARALSQMTHVQERLIELENIHAHTTELEHKQRKQDLIRKINAALFDEGYYPYEDFTEERLNAIYKDIIEQEELSWNTLGDGEDGGENQVIASDNGSQDFCQVR